MAAPGRGGSFPYGPNVLIKAVPCSSAPTRGQNN